MKTMIIRQVGALSALLLCAFACESGGVGPSKRDGASGSAMGNRPDTAPAAPGTDAAPDAAPRPDTAPPTTSDTAPSIADMAPRPDVATAADAAPDRAPDVTATPDRAPSQTDLAPPVIPVDVAPAPDLGPDLAPDVAPATPDAPADLAPDVAPDMAPDVAPDVEPDAASVDLAPPADAAADTLTIACTQDRDCDDQNVCTVDTCVAGACNRAPTTQATMCRASAGSCDNPEFCMAGVCPADTYRQQGALCRTAAGVCDQQEVCTGTSIVCPNDLMRPRGTVCRAAATALVCDVPDTCDGLNPACTPDLPFSPGPTNGLIAHWKADGNANDSVGTNHGTANGRTNPPTTVTYPAGKILQSFQFDGVDDNVEVPDAPALNPTAAITIMGWINLNPNAGSADVISKDGESSERQYLLSVIANRTGSHFRAHVGTGTGLAVLDGTMPVNTDAWYHVAMTYDGTTLRLFNNGAPDGTMAVTGAIIGGTQPLRIGGGAPANETQYYFPGRMDDVRLYNRALSPTEIQGLYATNSPCTCTAQGAIAYYKAENDFNDSVGTNNATGNAAVTFTSGPFDQAFSFNAGNLAPSIVGPTTLDFTGAFSLEAWINPNALGGRIIDKITAGVGDGYLLDTYQSRLRLIVGAATVSGGSTLSTGDWTHVVGVFDGTNLTVYVNGVSDGTAAAGGVTRAPANPHPLRLGIDSLGGNSYLGLMDEVRLYNRALTATEVANLHDTGRQCAPQRIIIITADKPAPMSPLGGFGEGDELPGPWRPRR